jgi:ketosteroid isomerase-like protein
VAPNGAPSNTAPGATLSHADSEPARRKPGGPRRRVRRARGSGNRGGAGALPRGNFFKSTPEPTAMSATQNKALIHSYFEVITGKNTERNIGDFFSADVIWNVPRSNPMIVPNPRRGHAAVMDLMSAGVGVYRPGSLALYLERLIADDAHVVAQFTLSATLANGNDYVNQYCFVFSISAGKIDGVWEYLDTLYQQQRGAFDTGGQ